MSNDDTDNGLSRRRLLTAAAGAGGLGVAGGLGSAAVLRDAEAFEGLLGTGRLDLALDWDESLTENATGSVDGDSASLVVDLDPGDTSGQALLELALPDANENNPANVWFWLTCPEPAGTDLAAALRIDIYESDSAGTQGDHVVGGSLREVANALRDGGEHLDLGAGSETCLSPGDDRHLLVTWQLAPEYDSGETLEFAFEFSARQCRHDGLASPFPSLGPCEIPDIPCPCCQLVGKLELEDDDGSDADGDGLDESYVQPNRTYAFTEGTSTYELVVGDTTTKGSGADTETTGVEIDVVGVGATPDPEVCAVVLKAGPGERPYVDADVAPGEDGFTPMLDSVEAPNGSLRGISSITVGICVDEVDGQCPANCVEPTGPGGGECP